MNSLESLRARRIELEDLLGCRVHVVTEDGLYWLLRGRILNEAKAL